MIQIRKTLMRVTIWSSPTYTTRKIKKVEIYKTTCYNDQSSTTSPPKMYKNNQKFLIHIDEVSVIGRH